MTGASLGYSGNYFSTDLLNYVGERSYQLSSTIASTGSSDMLRLDYGDAGLIHLQSPNAKYIGRPVRYHTTQSTPVALIIGVGLNQASIIHTQAVTIGTSIITRWPVGATHRLDVKPTRTPVIGARIDIR